MKKKVVFGLTLFLTHMCFSVASAEICGKRTAIQWGGPETRTRCIGYATGTWPWGETWKTCNEWATDFKQHSIDVVAHCPTPKRPTAVTQAIDACIGIAFARVIGTVKLSKETAFELLTGRLHALDSTFAGCIGAANVVGRPFGYRIDVVTNDFW